jgi:hypothetical protein
MVPARVIIPESSLEVTRVSRYLEGLCCNDELIPLPLYSLLCSHIDKFSQFHVFERDPSGVEGREGDLNLVPDVEPANCSKFVPLLTWG